MIILILMSFVVLIVESAASSCLVLFSVVLRSALVDLSVVVWFLVRAVVRVLASFGLETDLIFAHLECSVVNLAISRNRRVELQRFGKSHRLR